VILFILLIGAALIGSVLSAARAAFKP